MVFVFYNDVQGLNSLEPAKVSWNADAVYLSEIMPEYGLEFAFVASSSFLLALL